MDFTWKHLITLIWLSKTLYAKHYLIETQDQANVTHTATTPSPALVTGKTWNSANSPMILFLQGENNLVLSAGVTGRVLHYHWSRSNKAWLSLVG